MINLKGIEDMSDDATDAAAQAGEQQEETQAATPDPVAARGIEAAEKQRLVNTRAKITLTFQVIAPLLNAVNKDDLQDYIINHEKIGAEKQPADKFTRKFANKLVDILDLIEDQGEILRAKMPQGQQQAEDQLVDSAVEGPEGVPVPMIPVQSSHVGYLGYDKESQNLFVTFNDGATFRYGDVPEEVADAFLNADSVGKFYHSDIKNNYESEKIASGRRAGTEAPTEAEVEPTPESAPEDEPGEPEAETAAEIPGAQKPAVPEDEGKDKVAVESEQPEPEVYKPGDDPAEETAKDPVEKAA